MLTDSEKGAVQLAIAAAAETVAAVAQWRNDYNTYDREDVLIRQVPRYAEQIRNLGSDFRDEGQWGY